MSGHIRLVLAIHNHQPIGNFEDVFENAYRDSYAPFLDVIQDYPDIPISLHNSGSLLEWLVDAHPEYIDRIRALTERGQIEVLGGPFYEPILAGIPRRDRIGQIVAYSRYLENLFGQRIRGMWVPERVWEPAFTADIAEAGIEYTLLDDFHFRNAGVPSDQLYGHFITEDDGRMISIFPGSETLRYTIPFREPHETIEYLDHISRQHPNAVVVFGDDGEKFGTWPGTKKHVYEDGWLRRFLDLLRENSDWLRVATLAEAVDQVPPLGRCYIPDGSYREMTEWALPVQRQIEYEELAHHKHADPDWPQLKSFMRGGLWRNFRVKYPESNEMYARMLDVSRRLDEISQTNAGRENPDRLGVARTALYRAQCNCSYWHGAFGGLYLPHLRNAVYHQLIAADSLLESIAGHAGRWVQVEAADYDFDARKEIRLAGDRLIAWLAPSRGGHVYELDVRSTRHNLLATLNRRPEIYHEKIRQAAQGVGPRSGGVASIDDLIKFKQPDLDKKIAYDTWPRKTLVDHFLRPGLTLDEFQRGEGEIGDFVTGVYDALLRRSNERVEVKMSRVGTAGTQAAKITKTVALETAHGSTLEIHYLLENLTPSEPVHFGVEFNFAGMAAGAPDRYFYDSAGQQIGPLESVHDLGDSDRIGLVDEWLGVDAAVETSVPARIWTFPIQTISQSEGGFELVHQSTTVVPHWEFPAPADGKWEVTLKLPIDTSAAQAKQLREAAVT